MELRNLFLVNAIIALLYGITLMVIPSQFLAFYDISVDMGGALIAQLFGVALIAVGLITWFARDAEPSEARSAIVQGLLWTDVLGALVCIIGQLQGAVNGLGWTSVALYVLLGAGYAYFLYGAKEPATT